MSGRRGPLGYHAMVGGIGGTAQRMELEEETDFGAVCAAFGAASPFGHTLGKGRRFLGYFEAGDARSDPDGRWRQAMGQMRPAGGPC